MKPMRPWGGSCLGQLLLLALGLVSGRLSSLGAVPPPEKLLPEETLLVVTAPDFAKARSLWERSAQAQLWKEPAMKPFREHFLERLNQELLEPLERELGLKLEQYSRLPQGQVSLALIENGWQATREQPLGLVLLLDTKERSGQLQTNLMELRQHWSQSGKKLQLETIQGYEFVLLSLSSNEVPKALSKFFPPSSEVQELGAETPEPKAAAQSHWVIGQAQSLLLVGNSTQVMEKILARLSGAALPALADQAVYQSTSPGLLREAPLYGWVNAKGLFELWSRQGLKKDNPQAPNPFEILKPEKLLSAMGFSGLRSVAFSLRDSNEGSQVELFLGAPESSRQGLLRLLAGEPKPSSAPAFVPADAVKFLRWRLDGQKSWATMEKMLGDISPQWLTAINFIIDTANAAAKQKEPGFDVRKNLIGNLGDDLISYQKPPREAGSGEPQAGPSLLLVGSPNPEQLASSLKSILIFVSQTAGAPTEREFLGRKIYSVALPALSLPLSEGSGSLPRSLHYAASGGYLALSSEPASLEEYLRSAEAQRKGLRELSGLSQAAQKVGGSGSFLFGYQNQVEMARAFFQWAHLQPSGGPGASARGPVSLLPGAGALRAPQEIVKSWLDYSLLPPFEQVSKYFNFSVYGGSATVEGLSFKLFSPRPVQLSH